MKEAWIKALCFSAIAALTIILFSLPLLLCRGRPRHVPPRTAKKFPADPINTSITEKLEAGLAMFRMASRAPNNDDDNKINNKVPPFAPPLLPLQSPPRRWSPCDNRRRLPAVEVGGVQGSKESRQMVKLPADRFRDEDGSRCFVRLNHPLPRPCRPEEAYFEITILYFQGTPPGRRGRIRKRLQEEEEEDDDDDEGDRVRLIRDVMLPITDYAVAAQTTKSTKDEDGGGEPVVSLGMTVGDPPPGWAMPGTYSGSIGFHSNGSVFLDGMELASESERIAWMETGSVIGCAFKPSKKKVFLTVDGEVMHVIYCDSEAYRNPLYPVLAANAEVKVMVNMGQSAFKYPLANKYRPASRCSGSDDGRELSNMQMVNPEWYDIVVNSKRSTAYGNADMESDLFEISLQR